MVTYRSILKKAFEEPLTREEALFLFKKINSYDRLMELLKVASKVRDNEVGRKVKLMGFIASITPCTVDPPCRYCFRWSNPKLFTWEDVLSDEELKAAMETVESKGLRRVELGGGTFLGEEGRKTTLRKAEIACKASRKVSVWINNGPSYKPEDVYELKKIGVEGIACNFETTSKSKYRRLRPGLNLKARMEIVEETEKADLGIDNTLMIGLGDWHTVKKPYREWVDFLFYFAKFSNLRIMEIHPFRPIRNSPVQKMPSGSEFETVKAIAIARLIYRSIDISGAQSILGLLAGANLIMHVYPITKSFRAWGKHPMYSSRVERVFGNIVVVDNFYEVTRNAREMGFEIEF